ncbi:MAG: DsrH/TusB family sulfur metabolism protein [Halodesulfurarchaeum sp.]
MLYLIDKPHEELALRTVRTDPDPTVVLVQDGVLLEPDVDAPVYAVRDDLEARGITPPDPVEAIDYDDLVDLVFESPVKTFV